MTTSRASDSSRWILVTCVVLVYAFVVFASEKIQVEGGLGWDGAIYGQWARDGQPPFAGHRIARYYVSRSLPSVVVHQVLRGVHAELTNANVIRAFEIINILLMLLAAWCWTHIADRLAVTERARWLGALVLFGNCSHLKISAFYPVLLDEWAFALALLQLLLFIDRRRWWLMSITAVGGFCWPTALYSGAALIALMPKQALEENGQSPQPWPRLGTLLALLAAGWWALVCWSVIHLPFYIEPITPSLVRLSLAVSVAVAFVGWRPLLAISLLPALRRTRDFLGLNAILGVVLLLGVVWLQRKISFPDPGYDPPLLDVNAFTSIQKPGIFLVAHVIFFGPIVLVAMFRWREIVARFSRFGPGLGAVMLGGVFLFLNSESRRLGDIFGFVAPFAIKILDDLRLPRRFLLAFAALSLFFSKVWLTIEGDLTSGSEFPGQLYFMNHGPWMTMTTYLLQAAFVIPVAFWIWRSLRAAPAPTVISPAR